MGNDQSTGDYFDLNLFRYSTLQIVYSDNDKIVREINAIQPEVMVFAIDSRKRCPHFLTSDEFYSSIQRKDNVFFVDVGVSEDNAFVEESVFVQKLGNIDKHLIIQCGTFACTRVFVKEPGKEVQILDLNSWNSDEPIMTEDELIYRLKNKDTFGVALVVDVIKQGQYGKFHDKPVHHRTLTNASFAVNKALGSKETLKLPFQQPEIRSVDYCTLVDYAVLHDDFLTVRLLSSHTWELLAPNLEELSTLEIAAKYSSPLVLATLLHVDLPIPFGNIAIPKYSIKLLHPSNYYGNNTPLLTAVKTGKYDNVDFFIRCGIDVNASDRDGKTCLWYVVTAEKWEMAKCLVERGANVTLLASDQSIALLEFIFGSKLVLDDGTGICDVLRKAIQTNNVDVLKFLFDKWQEDYRDSPVITQNIEGSLCKVYEDLRLQNVSLSKEVQFVVEDKMIQSRFFIDRTSVNEQEVAASLDGVIERIDLVLKGITDLKTEYTNDNAKDVDGKFVLIARFIGQSIHVLKRQLKSTYGKLPWEEMKFCLVNFIACATTHDFNVVYKLVLDKDRIISHLNNFALKLEDVKSGLTEKDVNSQFPNKVIDDVSGTTSLFKELYTDYQLMKDVYSLKRVEAYVRVALRVKLDERQDVGKLVIERTLQVIGECLKTTIESPNMSNHLHKILLSSASKNVREIITVLRDSLSHSYTLKRKLELEGCEDLTFFRKVQNDFNKIERDIGMILYKYKVDAINVYFDRIINCDDVQKVKNMLGCLNRLELGEMVLERRYTSELEKVKELVLELSNEIEEKTEEEQGYFAAIYDIFDSQDTRLTDVKFGFIDGMKGLDSLNIISKIKYGADELGTIQNSCRGYLKDLNSVTRNPPERLNEIVVLVNDIYNSFSQRNQCVASGNVKHILLKVYDIYNRDAGSVRGIDEFKERLEKRETDILNKAEKEVKRVFVGIRDKLKETDKKIFDDRRKGKKESYVAKRDLGLFFAKLISDGHEPVEPELLKNRALLDLLGLKKGKLNELQAAFDDHNWKQCKSLVANIRSSYQTLFNSVNNSMEAEKHDMSYCFKEFLNSLDFAKNSVIKKDLDKAIRNIFECSQQLQNYFDNRLTILKLLLPADNCVESILKWKQDKELQIAIEMLVLDLTEMLDNAAMFVDNRLFMDRYSPVLMGKTLRNYLAHGDALIDILPFDPFVAIISNAFRFIREGKALVTKRNYLIGERIVENHSELSDRYRASLHLTNLQNKMFIAARAGDLGLVKDYIAQGVDVRACDGNKRRVVHFAAQGNLEGNVEVLKYCLDQKLCIDSENGFQSPIHVAAKHGNGYVLRYLVEEMRLRIHRAYRRGTLPLHMAAKNGHNDIVRFLLRSGAKVDAKTSSGMTALHYAARNGHNEVVVTLLAAFLQKNINADVVNRFEWTPLHYAVLFGHSDIVVNLLGNGAQVNTPSGKRMTPLHLAAQHGHKAIAETLLGQMANVDPTTDNGRTPLHLAALNGHSEIVKLLLNHSANIVARDEKNWTALHMAAHAGHMNVVNVLLLYAIVTVDVCGKDGIKPLHMAAQSGHEDIVDVLWACNATVDALDIDQWTPLHLAAENGYHMVVNALLKNEECKAEVNARNKYQGVPLHYAARNGHQEIVEVLLNNGAEIGAATDIGRTALHFAAQYGHTGIVDILLKRGANVNITDKQKYTPLHCAAGNGHKDVITALIKSEVKAQLDAKNDLNYTPLHLAARAGHTASINALLDGKSEINAKDDIGQTPLHLAAGSGYVDAVVALLARNAEIDAKDRTDGTPLHTAIVRGHKDVVVALLAKGADVNSEGYAGLTPLYMAMFNGNDEIMLAVLDAGAEVGVADADMVTPLHFAACNGNREVCRALLNKGADFLARNSHDTVLHNAVGSKDANIVQMILDKIKGRFCRGTEEWYGAVNAKDGEGDTPLMWAAEYGLVNVAKLLVEQGDADVRAINYSGMTVLHWAAKCGQLELVRWLVDEKGAVVGAVGLNGKTPLDLAEDGNHDEIANYLKGKMSCN